MRKRSVSDSDAAAAGRDPLCLACVTSSRCARRPPVRGKQHHGSERIGGASISASSVCGRDRVNRLRRASSIGRPPCSAIVVACFGDASACAMTNARAALLGGSLQNGGQLLGAGVVAPAARGRACKLGDSRLAASPGVCGGAEHERDRAVGSNAGPCRPAAESANSSPIVRRTCRSGKVEPARGSRWPARPSAGCTRCSSARRARAGNRASALRAT